MNAGRILDVFWPRRCELCGAACDRPGRHVCAACLMRLPFTAPSGLCRKCGREVEGLKGEFLCEECSSRQAPAFDRACSALRFYGEARDLVLGFKFNGKFWLKDDFGDWLAAAVESRFKTGEIDGVAPMPSTLVHRIGRGFNQCVYLAKGVCERTGLRYAPDLLARRGNPRRQSELGVDERRKNVAGTFAVRKPDKVKGRTILVVDDIMTTGSTLSECARMLKAAGAARVWCATLARAIGD